MTADEFDVERLLGEGHGDGVADRVAVLVHEPERCHRLACLGRPASLQHDVGRIVRSRRNRKGGDLLVPDDHLDVVAAVPTGNVRISGECAVDTVGVAGFGRRDRDVPRITRLVRLGEDLIDRAAETPRRVDGGCRQRHRDRSEHHSHRAGNR